MQASISESVSRAFLIRDCREKDTAANERKFTRAEGPVHSKAQRWDGVYISVRSKQEQRGQSMRTWRLEGMKLKRQPRAQSRSPDCHGGAEFTL